MNYMKCDKCGKFIKGESKYSWAEIYDFPYGGLDHESFRCEDDTSLHGEIQSNAKPYNNNMSPYQGVRKKLHPNNQI